MYNFIDLNNNVEVIYEKMGRVPTYSIYTKKDLEIEPKSNVLITDKLIMEEYDGKIDLIISTADININLPSDEHLRYLISSNNTDGSWELYLINLTTEKITLNKDSRIAEFKAGVDSLFVEQYKEIYEKYNNLGNISYSLRGLNIFDKDGTAKDIKYSMSGQEEQILIKL